MMQMDTPIPPLVLPGHLCNRRLFTHQMSHLGDVADFFVADLYCADTVHDLEAAAIVSMPQQFAILANSMGGSVAFEVHAQSA